MLEGITNPTTNVTTDLSLYNRPGKSDTPAATVDWTEEFQTENESNSATAFIRPRLIYRPCW